MSFFSSDVTERIQGSQSIGPMLARWSEESVLANRHVLIRDATICLLRLVHKFPIDLLAELFHVHRGNVNTSIHNGETHFRNAFLQCDHGQKSASLVALVNKLAEYAEAGLDNLDELTHEFALCGYRFEKA